MPEAILSLPSQNTSVTFVESVVVGRPPVPGAGTRPFMAIDDATVSRRHCVIRQSSSGRFYLRDESSNGTWVNGRRLVPNVETEIVPGDIIDIAGRHSVVLGLSTGPATDPAVGPTRGETVGMPSDPTEAAILVGDVVGYTGLNERVPPGLLWPSLRRVFTELESEVQRHGGSIKEFQGDAIFAYWTQQAEAPDDHAVWAARCALALERCVTWLARNPVMWSFGEDPSLEMDWALTTGEVIISTLGARQPVGLAMVGDPVNQAFRLEKLAGEKLGRILVSGPAERRIRDVFELEPVGPLVVDGRETLENVYSLVAERQDCGGTNDP